jgi:hypothetical protein
MKHIIYVVILTAALLSFGRQQSAAQGADAAAEQEVRQTIEKYRTALLQRDAATLEQISTSSLLWERSNIRLPFSIRRERVALGCRTERMR